MLYGKARSEHFHIYQKEAARDSNPAGVADLAGDVVLDDGGQDPIEDEHNVLADNATGQSSVGKER